MVNYFEGSARVLLQYQIFSYEAEIALGTVFQFVGNIVGETTGDKEVMP